MKTILLVGCVSIVVVVGYLAVFFIIQHSHDSERPLVVPPEPNFSTTTIHYQDEKGRTVEQEKRFEVTTEITSPEVLKKLPPPPDGRGAAPSAAPAAGGPTVNVPR